jgi:DNA-binding NtrC family response regulator
MFVCIEGTTNMIAPKMVKNQRTIMLLDDDSHQREYLSDVLQENGYQVISFADANEALSAIRQKAFHLVITDLKMPDIDGLKFVEMLHEIHSEIPVIMVTGHASVETYFKALGLGVFEFINKPINESEIKRIVQAVIDKSNQRAHFRAGKNILRGSTNSKLQQQVLDKKE